jgi:hypothetical protein
MSFNSRRILNLISNQSNPPVTPITFGNNNIAAGTNHGLAIVNNTLYVWGGIITSAATYNKIPSILKISLNNKTPVSVAAGDNVSVVLFSNGTVYTWTTSDTTNHTLSWTGITQICCNFGDTVGTHVYGLKSNGTVISYNAYATSGTTWNVPTGLSDVIKLSKGLRHMIALKSDGTIVTWGPTANLTSTSLYYQDFSIFTNIKDIFAGAFHTYGINNNNQIIDTGFDFTWRYQTNAINISNAIKMSFGFAHGIALKQDKTVVLWGDNTCNQRDLPSSFINSDIADIAANAYTTYILKENGKIYGLGNNYYQQITDIPIELTDSSYYPYFDEHSSQANSYIHFNSNFNELPYIMVSHRSGPTNMNGPDRYFCSFLSYDGMRIDRGMYMSGMINNVYKRNDGKYLIVGDFYINNYNLMPTQWVNLWGTYVVDKPYFQPDTNDIIYNSAACGGLRMKFYDHVDASNEQRASIKTAYILNSTEVANSTNVDYFFLGGNFNTIISNGVRTEYSKIAVFTNLGDLPTSGEFLTFNNFIKNSGGFYRFLINGNYTNAFDSTNTFDDTTLVNDIKVFITSTGEKRVIVGGSFYYYKSSDFGHGGICALRFNGTAFSYGSVGWMGSLNNEVYRIKIDDDNKKIYAVGLFTSHFRVGVPNITTSTPYIVKFNEDGTLDNSFLTNLGTGPNARVRDIEILPNNLILIVGEFTSFNGSTANRIIFLNQNGTIYSPFNLKLGSGANGDILGLKYYSAHQKIYVYGEFTSFNGQPAHYSIRLNLDGSIDKKFVTYIDDPSSPSGSATTRDNKYSGQFYYYDNLLDNSDTLPKDAYSIIEYLI